MTQRDPVAPLTVMTYNVGNGMAEPARLTAYLRTAGADIVGLQELDAAQAVAVARTLTDVYPYQVLAGTGFSGRGLLSRRPITAHEWLHLSPDRPDLRAEVDVAGHRVTVLVAHPPPPRLGPRGAVLTPTTVAQIVRLATTALDAAPAVLVGDFNMTPRHPRYAYLAASGLVDAYRAAGVGRAATFPLRPGRTRRLDHHLSWVPLRPFARIDFVWHTPDLRGLVSWVEDGAGSDHRPVLARLALPSGGTGGCSPQP